MNKKIVLISSLLISLSLLATGCKNEKKVPKEDNKLIIDNRDDRNEEKKKK
ncbi:hypothetical protein [Peptoniphilus timonensis]|uniref:hypothetical protein n=1 Tax=Peptoniphilus timonensis TaxID=1268254 RepID=UPI000305F311|nr:hypothetical protein [Peptoniphilus timonensis]